MKDLETNNLSCGKAWTFVSFTLGLLKRAVETASITHLRLGISLPANVLEILPAAIDNLVK